MNIFLHQMMIFRDSSVWFIDDLMKMPHLNRKCPTGAARRRMKFKANLVFHIFLVVVYAFMHSHKDMNVSKFNLPTTKHFMKVESVKLSKG